MRHITQRLVRKSVADGFFNLLSQKVNCVKYKSFDQNSNDIRVQVNNNNTIMDSNHGSCGLKAAQYQMKPLWQTSHVYDRLTVVVEFDVIELLSARLVPYILVNGVVAEFIQADDVGEWLAARL